MHSPFAVFRKHQKVLMVVLTGMAMFAFVFLDAAFQTGGTFPMLLGVMLGAGIFWIIGTQTGKPTEYAIAGALLGAAIGFVGMRLAAPPPAVATSVGDFSRRELQDLINRRRIANEFLARAFASTNRAQFAPNPPQFGFGLPLDRDVILGYLLRHEAAEMGLKVSDAAVTAYIKELTNNNLSTEEFKKIRRDLGLSESALYNVLRDELLARRAAVLSQPRWYATPARYWDIYCKLNVKHELDVAAIPVELFVHRVKDPPAEELQAFFNEHKSVPPNTAAPGAPGFLQPRKVNVAYLEADYATFAEKVPPVTDAEIVAYYQQNKERLYKQRPIPDDFDSSRGGTPGPVLPEFAPDERPAVAPRPPEPAGSPPPATPPGNDPAGDSQELPGGSAVQFSLQDRTGEEAAGKDTAAAPSEEPAVAPRPGETSPTAAAPQPASPEYRPLDETLRADIRETLLRQRVQRAMRTAVDNAVQKIMLPLSEEYRTRQLAQEKAQSAGDLEELKQSIARRLRDYAARNGLRYDETGLMSAEELQTSGEHPIGTAAEPVAEGRNPADARTVVSILFGTRPDQLYEVNDTVEDPLSSSWFAYWKIDDRESRVPGFEEPGIREAVLAAWKQQKARSLAEERARALREKIGRGKLPEALANETVTGEADGLRLTVLGTGAFTYLSTSTAPQHSLGFAPVPVLSPLAVIDRPDEALMNTVCQELAVGEVGVVPNADRSVYYVVQVRSRTPQHPAADELFRQQFLKERLFGLSLFGQRFRSTYDYVVDAESIGLSAEWSRRLVEKYKVRWNDEPLPG